MRRPCHERTKATERALLLAAFSVALGFGALIPVLPVYLAASSAESPWHEGVLPVVFLVAASLSAPLWGHLSDQVPRRRVVLGGLAGAIAAMVPFLAWHSVAALYTYQTIAGVSFGAVGPVALAMLYEIAPAQGQARGVAWFNSATLLGYFAGPAFGGWVTSLAGDLPAHQMVLLALGTQALLVSIALGAVASTTTSTPLSRDTPVRDEPTAKATQENSFVGTAVLAAFMIGAFEIGASLYARSPLHQGSSDVTGLFMACSAGMFLAQAILPRLPPRSARVRIARGCVAVSALLLAVMAIAHTPAALVVLGGLQGMALGLATGLLNFEAAASPRAIRGRMVGYQSSALNAGQAVGSAAIAGAFITLGAAGLSAVGTIALLTAAFVDVRWRAREAPREKPGRSAR